jgi:hypothetical protein
MSDQYSAAIRFTAGDELRAWNPRRGRRNDDFWAGAGVDLRNNLRLEFFALGCILTYVAVSVVEAP